MGRANQGYQLSESEQDVVWWNETGEKIAEKVRPGFLLPGSFHPFHQGHLGLFNLAGSILNTPGAFEITIQNVDKPVLEVKDVIWRVSQFQGIAPCVITRAGTFLAKARLFPGTVFVVGLDTAARVIDPRFYGDCSERMHEALKQFEDLGCSFLVAGRLDPQGHFQTLADLSIPPSLASLFRGIPEELFRIDISSTLLRKQSEIRLE